MLAQAKQRRWTITLDGHVVRVGLSDPLTVLECYDLADDVHPYLANADVLVLEGDGWTTERMRRTSRLLHTMTGEHGVEFRPEAPGLRFTVVRI